MRTDLTASQLNLILKLLKQALGEGVAVYLYGSRARGTARRTSDFDLVLTTDHPLSFESIALARELLSESDLPVAVDLQDRARLSDEFFRSIEADMIFVGKTGV